MRTSTVRASISFSRPQTASSSCSRENTPSGVLQEVPQQAGIRSVPAPPVGRRGSRVAARSMAMVSKVSTSFRRAGCAGGSQPAAVPAAPEAEGLGQVVIRAHVQPAQVVLSSPRAVSMMIGTSLVSGAAQVAADFSPERSGNIQSSRIALGSSERARSTASSPSRAIAVEVARVAQIVIQQRDDGLFVFDDQHQR